MSFINVEAGPGLPPFGSATGALLDRAADGGGFVFGAAAVGSAASADEGLAQAEQFVDPGVDVGDPFVEQVADGGTWRDTAVADCELKVTKPALPTFAGPEVLTCCGTTMVKTTD